MKLPDDIAKIRDELADHYVDETLAGWEIDEEFADNLFKDGFGAAARIFLKELEQERLKNKSLVEVLKDTRDFAQDVIARANRAIDTDCPKCDYQCAGCIHNIDDCEDIKKKITKALANAQAPKEK